MRKQIAYTINLFAVACIYCLNLAHAQSSVPAVDRGAKGEYAEAEKAEAENAKPYETFETELGSAHYDHNGFIRNKEQLQSIINGNRITGELARFMEAADFSTQTLFLYSFVHQGSGSDSPAYKLKLADGILNCTLYDGNKNNMRTADLRSRPCFFALRIGKDKIKEVKVRQEVQAGQRRIGPNAGRSFYTDIEEDFGIDQAVRIIGGLGPYRGKKADEIRHLKVFECTSYNLSDEDVRALSMLPDLERVFIRNSSWKSSEVKHLNKLNKLNDLFVGGHYLSWSLSGQKNNFSNEHLAILDIPTLESIGLSSSSIDSEGLTQLARFPKLREIELGHIPMDDKAGQHLANLKQCTCFYGLNVSSAEFIGNLCNSLKLEKLNMVIYLADLEEERKVYRYLGKMKSLVWLHVGRTHSNLDDEAIAPLDELTQLKHLGLVGYHDITDAGLVNCIKEMKQLESLSIGRASKVGDAWISQVGKLPLKRLDVRQNQLTNHGIAMIAESFPDIEEINFRHNGAIDNGAVEHLLKMSKLKYLNLMATYPSKINKELLEGITFYDVDEPYHDSWHQKFY